MKIIFTANHNPHFVNTNVYKEKAFREEGNDVMFFDDRDFVLPGRLRGKFDTLYNWDVRRMNRKLLSRARVFKPDVCVVSGGQRILGETVAGIRSTGVKMFLWTTDAPRYFGNIIRSAFFYDHIFCSGSEAEDILKKAGSEKISWLPFACDPEYHRPVELSDGDRQKYARDISFVGSFYPNRAALFESIADLDIGIWGPGWSRLSQDSPLSAKAIDRRVNYEEWVKIYGASKITVISHFSDGKTPCYQASPKLFEALACGSFVLCDEQKDARALFKDREHLVFFENKSDLREKIKYYVSRPEERSRVALNGRKEVVEKHTYRARIKDILKSAGSPGAGK